METELASDDLPWGAALIPEWWSDCTPHHVIDFDEIEMEHRRERARLSALVHMSGGSVGSDHMSEDGSLRGEMTGPYALPGFQASDGIHDASFCNGSGQPRWYITTDGFFYVADDPDVKYTPAQMVESGYLPENMEDHFGPGWDRARALSSPVDNNMYAREESHQFKKPDWMKKRLRSTDQGTAIRHGVFDLEGKPVSSAPVPSRSAPPPPSTRQQATPLSPSTLAPSAQPSNAWARKQEGGSDSVPDWQKKRSEILKAKAEELAAGETVEDTQAQAQTTTTSNQGEANKNSARPWQKPKEETAASSSAPAWKKSSVSTNNNVEHSWKKKQEDTAKSPKSLVPAWKKKQEETSSATESPVPAWRKKQDDASATTTESSLPPWKQKKIEDSSSHSAAPSWQHKAKQQQESTSPATSWKKPAVPTAKKETVARPEPIVPAWQKKKTEEEVEQSKPVSNDSSSAAKSEEKGTEKPEEEKGAKPEEPAVGTSKGEETVAMPKEEKSEENPSASKEASQEDVKGVSQEFVLKLMSLQSDAARAKELRNMTAPTPENNHTVRIKPNELLQAIAHHATSWKGNPDNKEKIDSLRQVAIIGRLVIMKLYGSSSPELKHFEEGLRPAFS